jgi:GntR family transcriptional regulator, carbon starvation induced regulator
MLGLVESAAGRLTPTSQTTTAYVRLRGDILAGRLAPSERLKVLDLAKSLEVSPGAIREALSRLIPEQLVVSREQKGFAVAPLSIADLEDLTDLRCEVEAIALRRSVEQGDSEWEAAVLATAHRLHRTPQRASEADPSLSPDWVDRHAALHAALISACGSRRLVALHAQLYEQSERYRGLATHLETHRDVATEHQELVDAALDRNADRLVKLMLEHMRRTTARIVAGSQRQLKSSP